MFLKYRLSKAIKTGLVSMALMYSSIAHAAGADASNPTAAVNFQDVRYRYYDVEPSATSHSFELKGSYVFAPNFKLTHEIHGVRTDQSGEYESDLEILKLKGIHLSPTKIFGIKSKIAIGAEWLKDLGDLDKGIGTGTDQIAPLIGIGWSLDKRNLVITLVQYFHSYEEDSGVDKVRTTGPRLIYIRKMPEIRGWTKLDYKGSIDHEHNDYTDTLEVQVGTMFSKAIGAYAEVLLGNEALNSPAFNWGAGIGLRFMY